MTHELVIFCASLVTLLIVVYFLWRCYQFHKKTNNTKNNNNLARPIDLIRDGGQTLASLWKVNKAILSALDFEKLTEKVVNVVLQELDYLKIGYRISVLTVVDREAGIVRRVSFSPTPEALEILRRAKVRFEKIKIPLAAKKNLLVRAIENQKVYVTHDLSDVFYPEKTREIWRQLQHQVGIKTSLVFPLIIRGESIGAMIFSLSKSEKEVSEYEKGVLGGFVDAVAVALQNATLYKRLKEANKKLKDLDKRKDEFLSVAAHELRAPMTAIKGYLSMILEGDAGKIPSKAMEFLQEVGEGNERLIRLVNNMLNISRIEEGRMVYQMGVVSLGQVAKTVFDEFKLEAENKGLQISLNVPSDLKDRVYVDQDRIHEVIANLVSNGIKYTDKGSVNIDLSQPKRDVVRLVVKDTGYGISKKEQEKLFRKFVQTESAAGRKIGTGLGLYIVKLLIEKFGGKIGFESEVGKGSTFWFELPISSRHSESDL